MGALLSLIFISNEIAVFLCWNMGAEVLQTVVTGYFCWRSISKVKVKARFDTNQLRKIWRFAAGMSMIGATNIAISQADKLFVSKVFPLKTFGYYSAIWTIAGSLFFLTYPIITAVFPKYAQLFGMNARKELSKFYHESSIILAAVLIPIGISMIFFSKEILLIWLKITEDSYIFIHVLQLLLIGVMFNSLNNLPVNLHFAAGITRVIVYTNIIWIGVLPVMMWWLASVIGLLGAPLSWLIYNLFCIDIHVNLHCIPRVYKFYCDDLLYILVCKILRLFSIIFKSLSCLFF